METRTISDPGVSLPFLCQHKEGMVFTKGFCGIHFRDKKMGKLKMIRKKDRRRQWHPTPVFLPGESQGQGSLVGCHLWGHTELEHN